MLEQFIQRGLEATQAGVHNLSVARASLLAARIQFGRLPEPQRTQEVLERIAQLHHRVEALYRGMPLTE